VIIILITQIRNYFQKLLKIQSKLVWVGLEEGEPKPNQIKLRSKMFCCDVPFKIAFHGQTLAGRTSPGPSFQL